MRRRVLAALRCVAFATAAVGCSLLRSDDKSDHVGERGPAEQPEVVAEPTATVSERVPRTAYAAMQDLVRSNGAREPTLAAARAWANRELDAALWARVRSELALTDEEVERCWKERRVERTRQATYGDGSFIVVAKRQRSTESGASPASATTDVRTDEDWWAAASPVARACWLTAFFVETSGRFEILRAGETPCDVCGRRGVFRTEDATGRLVLLTCGACNGCGVVWSVTYR